ncbi:hypothetical protein ACWEPH_26365 [Nocardia beijingensis]
MTQLLLILLALPVLTVAASYATVWVSYWWELRHRPGGEDAQPEHPSQRFVT